MKISIEFNTPDEQIEFLRCIHADEAWTTLNELDQHLRSFLKHGEHGYKTPEDLATFVRQAIGEALSKVDE